MPSRVTVADIKSKFLRPSLTSYFEVEIPTPPGGSAWTTKWNTNRADTINLLCSEAVLPGSNLATFETNNDRTGVTERFAHRRIFDERIDLTFNVDGGMYSPIKFFEEWIDYITGASTSNENQLVSDNYFYLYLVVLMDLLLLKGQLDQEHSLSHNDVHPFQTF